MGCNTNSGLLLTLLGVADPIGGCSKVISEPCLTDRLSEGRVSCKNRCLGKSIDRISWGTS